MRPKHLSELEMTVATELSSTTITNILEAVPGIKTVLRSPAADAMVNLTRAAAGVGMFDIKDARELMRFAFRRGLINNEEHDQVLAEVEGAAQARQQRLAARKAARNSSKRGKGGPKGAHKAKSAKKAKPAAKKKAVPKKKPAPKKAKVVKKVRSAAKKAALRRKPAPRKAKAAKKAKPSARPKAKTGKAKKRR